MTGMMGPALDKLASLVDKYTELRNARKKMEQLRKELIAINLALEKHAAMENPDAQAKAWVSEMRELAYDMEDNIDLFTHHVDHEPTDTATTGVKRFFLRIIRKLKKLHYRHRFAQEIKQLHDLANESYRRRKRYRIEEGGSSLPHAEIDPRLEALYVEVEKLVGIQGPSQEIIGQLVGENAAERRRVVAVVGSGGSGKTTLAKQVYEKIRCQFSCAAFVSVSQKPNMNSLLWELLSQIGNHGGDLGMMAVGYCSDKQLIDRLRSHLEKQRLVVYLFIPVSLIRYTN